MIWLTCRQQRIGWLVFGLVLVWIATVIITSGLDAQNAYYQVVHGRSVAMCAQQNRQDAICQTIVGNFHSQYFDPGPLLPLFFLPPPVGMFLGASLVASELERGTYRMVWTQSVTRLRWLLVKVGAQMGVTLVAFAIIGLLTLWWNSLFGQYVSGSWIQDFDVQGIVPLAYMIYALALAIAAGTLLRNTVAAMFVTLVGYLAVRIPIADWRPYYVPPLSVTWDPYITTPKMQPGSQDWTIHNGYVGSAGHPIPTNPFDTCGVGGPLPGGRGTTVWDGLVTACTHAHGWLYTATWQPADRFWLLQGIESAIFIGLAAGLLALTFWWVKARIS